MLGLGWVAKVVGYTENESKITIDETDGITCNNVSLGINEEQWRTLWYETDYNWYKDVNGINISDIDTYSDFTGSSGDTYIYTIS